MRYAQFENRAETNPIHVVASRYDRGVDIEAFISLRPFLFHTTAASNLERLRVIRRVESTRRLFGQADRRNDVRLHERRKNNYTLRLKDHEVVIRDQRPLIPGAIDLRDGLGSCALRRISQRLRLLLAWKPCGTD